MLSGKHLVPYNMNRKPASTTAKLGHLLCSLMIVYKQFRIFACMEKDVNLHCGLDLVLVGSSYELQF